MKYYFQLFKYCFIFFFKLVILYTVKTAKIPSNTVKAFTYFTFLLLVLAIISVFLYNMQNTVLCDTNYTEVSANANQMENNLFYKIEKKAVGAWDVLFKNVNVTYKVTCDEDAFAPKGYSLKQVYPESSNPVQSQRHEQSISDTVIKHFNEIQKGNFQPYSLNSINSNAHGINNGVNSPLDQFEIRDLASFSIANLTASITNIGLYLTISAYLAVTFNLLATNYNKVIANNWSISLESIYATIHGIVINQINAVKGQVFFPFIYVLFIFILTSNLIGMIPYSFACTSHFILTFFISFTVVLGSTLLGFHLHDSKFFSLFVPNGCPLGLLPLLVLIELISYLARNVSLGLRLAANVLSGHMLLNILSGFAYKIMNSGFVNFFLSLIPLAFITAFSALELGIAFIQAQVFVVLSSSYIKDAIDLH